MKTLTMIETPEETTHDRVIRNGNLETRYDVSDFVNPDSWSTYGSKGKAFVILDGGFVQAIVFQEYDSYSEQDALDEAVDSGKLDAFQVSEDELSDYETDETSPEGYPEYDDRLIHLGNASEPFDFDSLDIWTVPMSVFAEDPALMTLERVMDRLDFALGEARRHYQATAVNDPKWRAVYQAREDLEDALTLCRFRNA